MKRIINLQLLLVMMLFIALISCREDFDQEFPDVLVINQPPTLSMDTLVLNSGFGSYNVSLSFAISDPENDELAVTAVSANTTVATVSVNSEFLIITEVGTGTSVITVTMDDGTDRELPVQGSIVVVIAESTVQYKFSFGLASIPDGTSFDDITLNDGTVIGRLEGSEGSSRLVQNGILEWTTDEYDVMSITFDSPMNLSSDATLHFEYAELYSENFGVTVVDAYGGSAEFGYDDAPFLGEMVLNSPDYNTLEFDISDYTGSGVDLSAVTSINFEIYGAQEFPEPQTFKIRFFGIGKTGSNPFVLSFNQVENGTSYDTITLDDGTIIGRIEGSDGSSRVVQNGLLEWTTDEWDVMSITFDEPLDLSSNSTFSMEYADVWSTIFEMTVTDANGGNAAFGWESAPFTDVVLNSPDFNILTFDLSDYTGDGVDLSIVTQITLEKDSDGEPRTFRVKKITIGE